MILGEFLNAVQKMRESQTAWRKHHRKMDAAQAHEWAKIVDRGLFEGITVVTTIASASADEERRLRLHLDDERDAGEPEMEMENDNDQTS